MFKNIRFGLKIGGGFAILLALLGFVAAMGFHRGCGRSTGASSA